MEITGNAGFTLSGVVAAHSSLARLRGLIGQDPYPLLLATSSVHGFGLRQAVSAVAIAPDGTVIAVRRLGPRRLLWMGGAKWILELPVDATAPTPGERLAFDPPWNQAERNGRPPLSMRHTDRQSG